MTPEQAARLLAVWAEAAGLAGFPPWGWRDEGPPLRIAFPFATVYGPLSAVPWARRSAIRRGWGDLIGVGPVKAGDPVDRWRLTYTLAPDYPPRVRFDRRVRLKRLLGRRWSKLVRQAMRQPQGRFLADLDPAARAAILGRVGCRGVEFWRAVRGIGPVPEPRNLFEGM